MRGAKPGSQEGGDAAPADVEFLPLKLIHKVHRCLLDSQVEIVPVPWYYRPVEVEPEPEPDTEQEPEIRAVSVTFAPPLKPLREGENWWDIVKPCYANCEAEGTKMVEGDGHWWATLDILAGKEEKKPRKDIMADVDEWLTKVTAKITQQSKQARENPNSNSSSNNKSGNGKGGKGEKQKEVKFEFLETTFGDHIVIECTFNNPRIRSRLEKLMGSNMVRITDRKYMIKLQERIREDHLENQKKRIQEREADEVEREKKLILEGKIPIEEAPKELMNHPVCKINQITKKILEDKKAKAKVVTKSTNYKTSSKRIKDAEKAEKEAEVEKEEEEEDVGQATSVLCLAESSAADPVDDIARGFMFCKEEYDKLKYEAPLVKMLKEVENVEEMYRLADEIVGPLKNEKIGK